MDRFTTLKICGMGWRTQIELPWCNGARFEMFLIFLKGEREVKGSIRNGIKVDWDWIVKLFDALVMFVQTRYI